jgi:hypothetical protein
MPTPGVAEERLLRGEGAFQPPDHRVEGTGEPATSSEPVTSIRRDRSVRSRGSYLDNVIVSARQLDGG